MHISDTPSYISLGIFDFRRPNSEFRTLVGQKVIFNQFNILNQLEALSGNRKGQYSLLINDQWRICFIWKDGDAYNVEIGDYH
jgi:Txe/YoeB family toxin of Txe-Axe toxin-antitoxin module